jgi:hypothetical protein
VGGVCGLISLLRTTHQAVKSTREPHKAIRESEARAFRHLGEQRKRGFWVLFDLIRSLAATAARTKAAIDNAFYHRRAGPHLLPDAIRDMVIIR